MTDETTTTDTTAPVADQTKHTYSVTMKDDRTFTVNVTLDWSNLTDSEIREIAARSVIINMQAENRRKYSGKAKIEPLASVFHVVTAARERAVVDLVTKAREALAKMTPEQRAEALAAYQ